MSWLRERPAPGRSHAAAAARRRVRRTIRHRALRVEFLEARTVMTALPFGASPDDTGEFMLGDVHVTVVLMESNNTIDNGTITYTSQQDPPSETINYTPENWTQSAINAVKLNIEEGINWWKQTLDALPTVRDGLLNFTFDWTHLNTPVQTGYEPIARRSSDYEKWVPHFLNPALAQAGLTATSSLSANIRMFNNYQRQQTNADWAFTIFVVNNANDYAADLADPNVKIKDRGSFAATGPFRNAFSFAGGRFMVVPASRPASTYAHEAGHMFWALDEYAGGGTHNASRGYYNTPNSNAWDNPQANFQQQPSIMTNDVPQPDPPAEPTFLLSEAYAARITSQSSAEMIGWRDTDADGIFDVLDVPFELTGTGRFDSIAGSYRFTGSSSVRTLPNLNPTFLQNDITINRIREVQFSVDGDPWQVAQAFPDRTYTTTLDLNIAHPALALAGSHTIKIRTIDTRTGAMSPEFVGTIDGATGNPPQSAPSADAGTAGFVFFDGNGNASWDANEGPLIDWAVELVDPFGTVLSLQKQVEPDDYQSGDVLNSVHPEVTLSVTGGDASRNEVQELTISSLVGATVTPAFNGVLGTALALDLPLTPGQVAASLNAIPALSGKIVVSYGVGVGKFLVTFNGAALAGTDVPLITQGAATGGGTLSAQTQVDPIAPDVYALPGPVNSTKPLVFGNYSVNQSKFTTAWSTSRQFRGDFAAPVTRVTLKALFVGGGASYSVGRLEAYSSAGVLLERYTTKVLTGGSETMTIARPTADIAYVVAYGHLGSEVGLDTLTWGPRSSLTTNPQGAWSLPSLLSGTYRVKVTPPLGHIVTMPQGGQYEVSYIAGQSVGNLNFGIFNTDNIWHNIALPENVNADPQFVVNAIDVLVDINWQTINGVGASLPQNGDPNVTGYVDVNNDKVCNVTDVLNLVNYITLHPPTGGGGGGGSFAAADGASFGGSGMGGGGGPGSEGEDLEGTAWSGVDSLRVSLAYLESREDVHIHLDGDDHDHEEQGGSTELFPRVNGANRVPEFNSAGTSLAASDFVGAALSRWTGEDDRSEAADLPLIDSDEQGSWSASAARSADIPPLVDVEDAVVPLARRKRLERTIDVLAEDLLAVAAKNVRVLARGTRR